MEDLVVSFTDVIWNFSYANWLKVNIGGVLWVVLV